jgi:WD40 repeat protein
LSWLDKNGHVHVWNAEGVISEGISRSETLFLEARDASSLALAQDGGIVALGRDDGTVTLYGVESEEAQDSRSLCQGAIHSLAFSPDGGTLAAGCARGVAVGKTALHLWDLRSGVTQNLETTETGHSGVIVNLAFSHDGGVLASGDMSGTVGLWDTATGTGLRELVGHSGDVTTLAFSPDGATLASGDWHGTVILWAVEGTQ